MRILPVRAPPGERFPRRFAQVVDHPCKCRWRTVADGAIASPCKSPSWTPWKPWTQWTVESLVNSPSTYAVDVLFVMEAPII